MYDIIDPMEELKTFREEMDNLFRDLSPAPAVRAPRVDIEDKKNKLIISAELPGIDKKDIDVHVEEDRVRIQAKRTQEKKVQEEDYYHRERVHAGFYRAFPLPARVDPNKAKSTLKDGVLRVELPKVKGQTAGRKVPIK